jgi:hypothetical protein
MMNTTGVDNMAKQKFSMADLEKFANDVAALVDAKVTGIVPDTSDFVVEHKLDHYFVALESDKRMSPHLLYRAAKNTEFNRFIGRGNDMHIRSADGCYTVHLGFEAGKKLILACNFFAAF